MDTTQIRGQATRIVLRDFLSTPMRTFHLTWSAFFLAFFGWFGIAPPMPIVACLALALLVRFSQETEDVERERLADALRRAAVPPMLQSAPAYARPGVPE